MVHTPWFPEEIPMAEAAEIGTRKVIAEHSTIGIVVTTDGSITDLPREAYVEAEARVISELKELGKPFLLLLNSARPESDEAQTLRAQLAETYDVTCLAVSCLDLSQRAVTEIIQSVLFEFPLEELQLFLPDWVDALPQDHPIKTQVFQAVREHMDGSTGSGMCGRWWRPWASASRWTEAAVTAMRLGTGTCQARLDLPRGLFYETMSQQTGFPIHNDGELLSLLGELAKVQADYKKWPPPWRRSGPRVRHRHPRRRGAGAGGAGDHQAGGALWGAPPGQGPQHPHDPGGHPGGGLPHCGQREAVGGYAGLPPPGV